MQGFYFEIGDRKLYKSFRLFIDTLTDFIKNIYIYIWALHTGVLGHLLLLRWLFGVRRGSCVYCVDVCLFGVTGKGARTAAQRRLRSALKNRATGACVHFTQRTNKLVETVADSREYRDVSIFCNKHRITGGGFGEDLGCLAIRKRRNHRCEKVRFTSGFPPLFSFFLFHLW